MSRVRVAAPATVANVGPGFDVFGLALSGPVDIVEAERASAGVELLEVTGDGGALPRSATENTAGVAATTALELIRSNTGRNPGGVTLKLAKGIPLASGLGSSAASAAAAARAVAELHPGVLSDTDLLTACLAAEELVAGRHLDNVAPALFGGFLIVRGVDPPAYERVLPDFDLCFVAVKPAFGLPTREAREALPQTVSLADVVAQVAAATSMVHALHSGDAELFARCFLDRIAAPARAPLIAGHDRVVAAAKRAGAVAVGVSGGGPTLVALVPDRSQADGVGAAMAAAFQQAGHSSNTFVSELSREGARLVP